MIYGRKHSSRKNKYNYMCCFVIDIAENCIVKMQKTPYLTDSRLQGRTVTLKLFEID